MSRCGSLLERAPPPTAEPEISIGNVHVNRGIDSQEAWFRIVVALIIASIALGSPYVATVALTPIAAEFGDQRSIPSAAISLAWLGVGVGGLGMGWIANRIGVRWTIAWGGLMNLVGLVLASGGSAWQLCVGYGLFVGLIGNAGINAPLYVYATRWFDGRRGAALALIASGSYIAGALWPPIFEKMIGAYGWRQVMIGFGMLVAATVIPLGLLFLKEPPPLAQPSHGELGATPNRDKVMGLSPNLAFGLLAVASFLCCIPMAMPQSHLIAFCGDLGFASGRGPAMVSLLLVCAFFSRQFWGWFSDRIGGLNTLLIGSAAQALAMLGFLLTQDEMGLFAVSAFFGLGFAGLIPAYVLAVRQLFPASEAHWRVPGLLLMSMAGMAAGVWVAGAIYDYAGFYAPSFATGLFANVLNFLLLTLLALGQRQQRAAVARLAN